MGFRKPLLLFPLLLLLLATTLALVVVGCGSEGSTSADGTSAATSSIQTTTSAAPQTTAAQPIEVTESTVEVPSPTTTSTSAPPEVTPHRLETRLPDGHLQGLVRMFVATGWGDYRQLHVDYVEILTGEEARIAAEEAGDLAPGEGLPNDYYGQYADPHEKAEDHPGYLVSPTVSITTTTFSTAPDHFLTWDEFVNVFLDAKLEGSTLPWDVVWWIERDENGTVVSITEYTVP